MILPPTLDPKVPINDRKKVILETLETISQSKNYNLWLYHHIAPHLKGSVLDIGSGIGNIASHYLRSPATKICLMEHDPSMIDRLEASLSDDLRTKIIPHSIFDPLLGKNVPPNSVDVITCANVLEHLENDIKALQIMNNLLNENGKIVLIVPALRWLFGSLDRQVGHYRRYHKTTLSRAVREAGLVPEKQYYINSLGIFSWFIAAKVLRMERFEALACRRLDNWVPFIQSLEKIIKPPFGQSLVAVCAKRP